MKLQRVVQWVRVGVEFLGHEYHHQDEVAVSFFCFRPPSWPINFLRSTVRATAAWAQLSRILVKQFNGHTANYVTKEVSQGHTTQQRFTLLLIFVLFMYSKVCMNDIFSMNTQHFLYYNMPCKFIPLMMSSPYEMQTLYSLFTYNNSSLSKNSV